MTAKIRNEKRRLSANFLNGIAVALLAIGAISPAVSVVLGAATDPRWAGAMMSVCLLASLGLHYGAQMVINTMEREDV